MLGRELADVGAAVVEQGPGWVRVGANVATENLAFPWLTLRDPIEVRGESVNALWMVVAALCVFAIEVCVAVAAVVRPAVWIDS